VPDSWHVHKIETKKKKVNSIRLNFIQNTLYMVFTDGAEDRFNLFQVDVYL
jgi:hypothetical protein